LRIGRWLGGQLSAQLGEQAVLLLFHGLLAQFLFLERVAQARLRRRRQGRRGSTAFGVATASQVGLRDQLGVLGAFITAGVDQHHLQRCVLEHPVVGLGVDEAHGQQHGVQGDRGRQCNLQGAE